MALVLKEIDAHALADLPFPYRLDPTSTTVPTGSWEGTIGVGDLYTPSQT